MAHLECYCWPPDDACIANSADEHVCYTTNMCFASAGYATSLTSGDDGSGVVKRFGCVGRDQSAMICQSSHVEVPVIHCCRPLGQRLLPHPNNGSDEWPQQCNKLLVPHHYLKPLSLTDGSDSSGDVIMTPVVIGVCVIISAILVLTLILITICTIRYRRQRRANTLAIKRFAGAVAVGGSGSHTATAGASSTTTDTYYISSTTASTSTSNDEKPPHLQYMLEDTVTSGSGYGLPMMIQRTINQHISLKHCIGRGRYGEVWCGTYLGERVAVKVFDPRDEDSWFRETEVYQTVLLRHDNILAFLAADIASRDSCTQLWLITYYHELGSLFDYLNHIMSPPASSAAPPDQMIHTPGGDQLTRTGQRPGGLDQMTLINLAISISTGLVHLHTEIYGGLQGKPAIAHRDIKSKNILVKSDMTCAIGDFGLAVMYDDKKGLDIRHSHRVGTKRYMAPELLDESQLTEQFDSYRQLDIYALALVLWELARATPQPHRQAAAAGTDNDPVPPAAVSCPSYEPPYYEYVGGVNSDPSFDVMRRVVCSEGRRPTLPYCTERDGESSNVSILPPLSTLMSECWHRAPSYRLPALRVKKRLTKMRDTLVGDCEDKRILGVAAAGGIPAHQ